MPDFNYTESTEFIPEFKGNKELPTDQQIKVAIEYPTNKLVSKTTIVRYRDGGSEVTWDYSILIDTCVTKIENVTVKKKPIKNGLELSQAKGLDELYQEIALEIQKIVKGVDLEK